jgi:hypothetical protein
MTCIMPPPALPPIEDHLARVVDETNKAAGYLASARAFRLVPRLNERWEESPTQLGFDFLRQGTHMAFLVTLAALIEETRKVRVNLPRLLRRLSEEQVRLTIAQTRAIELQAVTSGVEALRQRFSSRVAPLIPQVKDVRDNVAAHHGPIIHWPQTTIGLLNRALVRVVVLVDGVSELMTGERTDVRVNMNVARWQAAALWSKGIDGDPEVAPGRPDDDEWPGL